MFDYLGCVAGTVGVGLSDQALEEEVCDQAARMAVSECHFVLLVAEMDRRQSWAGPGLLSMAHWLQWRCGTSLGAGREQVRVGRALEKLPVLREAFATGKLVDVCQGALAAGVPATAAPTSKEWAPSRFIDVHHVVFWSEGGRTVMSNLTTLCRAHHRLVHEGGFRLEMDAPRRVRVWDRDGREVLPAPPLPPPRANAPDFDTDVEAMAYGGERMDLDSVLYALYHRTPALSST